MSQGTVRTLGDLNVFTKFLLRKHVVYVAYGLGTVKVEPRYEKLHAEPEQRLLIASSVIRLYFHTIGHNLHDWILFRLAQFYGSKRKDAVILKDMIMRYN